MFQTTNQSLVQSILEINNSTGNMRILLPLIYWGSLRRVWTYEMKTGCEILQTTCCFHRICIYIYILSIDMCHMYVYRSCSREPFKSFRWKGKMGWVKNYNRTFIDIYLGKWIHYLANLMCQKVLTREITGRSGRRFSNPQWAWSSPYRDPTDTKKLVQQ